MKNARPRATARPDGLRPLVFSGEMVSPWDYRPRPAGHWEAWTDLRVEEVHLPDFDDDGNLLPRAAGPGQGRAS